jgi:hypothetical protein
MMPACTTARGNPAALLRGRDGATRYAPPPPVKSMAVTAKAAALKG